MKRFLCALLFVSIPLFVQAAPITVTAGNVVPSASANYLPGDHYAISTITAGQAVYESSTVTSPSPTAPDIGVANAAGTGDAVKVVGIAVTGAGAGQPVKVVVRDPAFAIGGTCAAGDVIYLSPTSGGITSLYADLTSGSYVCVIGVGIASGKINLGASMSPGTASGSKFIGPIRADVPK